MAICSFSTDSSSKVTSSKVAIIVATFLMLVLYWVAVVLAHVKEKAEVSNFSSGNGDLPFQIKFANHSFC